jgi:hypothetical protein
VADVETLYAAIKALFPAEVLPKFERTPPGTRPPWTDVAVSLPKPNTRAWSKRVMTYRIVIRCRITTANTTAAWQLAPLVTGALEARRVAATGWECSPIEQLNADPVPYEDPDVTLTPTNSHPVILPMDFDFYATVKETP